MSGYYQAMRMEMRMEMTCSLRQLQDLDEEAQALYSEYADRLTFRRIIPTLHGPRIVLYHTVMASQVKRGWYGEPYAGGINDKIFVSDLVPRPYLRYALIYVYHLHTDWCLAPPRKIGRLTVGPPIFRAMEIELGLARVELHPDEFDRYWEDRRILGPIGFFKRTRRLMDASRRRIDAIADRFELSGMKRGTPWRLEDDLAVYRRTAPLEYSSR